jgi:hypothetical protein
MSSSSLAENSSQGPPSTHSSCSSSQSSIKKMGTAIKTAFKRTFTARSVTGASPSASPQKKKGRFKGQSAITTALASGTTTGLMRFFKRGTADQYQEQVQRETEESRKLFNAHEERRDIHKAEKSAKARASDRERQQKHRAGLYKKQIEIGE